MSDAVSRGDLPFAVAAVADRDGVRWQGAVGPANPTNPAGPDTIFRAFSQTKAIGSIALMIGIDRGLLTLDTPVVDVLPEFARIQVLDAFDDDGSPVFRAPRTVCTLRHLLTHTSGFSYSMFDERQHRYQYGDPGRPDIAKSRLSDLFYPLMFDPGASFTYGIGIDWACRLLEAVDGRRIDVFCREELFDPLGMHNTRFELDEDASNRLADLKLRVADGSLVPINYGPVPQPEFYAMGGSLYTSAPDYLTFLRMILNGGELDGRRYLSPQAMERVSTNQMPPGVRATGLKSAIATHTADVELFPPGTPAAWTATFLRNEVDIPGRRSAGSLGWAGLANSHYWIDPSRNIAAVLMTQLFPFCDPRFMGLYEEFERTVYAEYAG